MPKPDITILIQRNKAQHNGVLTCYICKKQLDESRRMSYVREHLDNNPKNNDINNLDIACRSCNKKKDPNPITNHLNPKEITLGVCARVRVSAWDRLRDKAQAQSAEFAKGDVAKPLFFAWFYKKMLTANRMSVEYAISNGANAADVSPDTAKNRYLRVLTCEESFCTVNPDKDIVWQKNGRKRFLKSNYKQLLSKYK